MTKGFIFDLDGTVYLDNHIIEGSIETIRYLRENGHKVVFFTNKSISTRQDYVKKLNDLGIEATIDDIVNSNFITAKYLKQHMISSDAAYVIGEKALLEELKEEGIRITMDSNEATYIVLGWDRAFTYEKLNNAYQAWVKNNAVIVATNPDRTCPVAGGQLPDCASMIGALEGATGVAIDLIMGKPSKLAAEMVVNEILQLNPEKCFMIGDRLETDIRMGKENGLNTILVLTGITTIDMVKASAMKPTYILESIKDIPHLQEIVSSPI
ncbi:HAD-IIA family hydrolase [Margalitia sp. FSL K6-0131]|uniref:HAD-IIA family hydrolase n=1 Tax=Margalitia sp. FSL K6-0131 TaxID=2954604 RepID=UPI0030F7E16A